MDIEDQMMDNQTKKSPIKYIVIIAVLIGLLVGGYFVYNQFFSSTLLTSNTKYFTFKTPKKYNFVENTLATDAEMGVYDEKKHVYIFGYAYQSQDDFKAAVDEFYQADVDTDYSSITDLKSLTISGFDAYSYAVVYTDSSNGSEYYSDTYFIDGDYGTYIIYVECLSTDQDKYEKDLSNIAKTFKELD